jgi:hypothetical protein
VALPAPNGAANGASRTVEIRLALSALALRTLSEPRVRRLVEIETESFAVLAPGAIGPLGDHVAYVWVDQPTVTKVVVEVRVGDRAVERREIAVRGLAGDVAARLVAIAVAEMVRAGMAPRPAPPPPPTPPPGPTPAQIERASRSAPALTLSPSVAVVALPGASGVVGGPGLALGFRYFGASEQIFGRWLTGKGGDSSLRWLELGAAVSYRFWLSPRFRLAVGGEGAFSSVHLGDALSVESQRAQQETWSARAGGVLAFEARVASWAWLALSAEPGAILRPVHYAGQGTTGVVEGAWIGFGLGAHFERVSAPK